MCLMPFQERIYSKVTAHGLYPEARLYPMMLGAMYVAISSYSDAQGSNTIYIRIAHYH